MRELKQRLEPTDKNLRVSVGMWIGKYHPHGDVSVYDPRAHGARVSRSLFVVAGQGNFGSVDGDPPAAERSPIASCPEWPASCSPTSQGTVDFNPEYGQSATEPAVLPAASPNLLITSSGIALACPDQYPAP